MKYQIPDKFKKGDFICKYHKLKLNIDEKSLRPLTQPQKTQDNKYVLCDAINCLDDADYKFS
ncbi:hypothetical protein [Niallia sp. RD1]|uniref:hypothetical protein n=1 Tax=Niallia sp. RD1 TaxID=2962858 RepID=UPI0020C19589|nr:hypothetical protein [Niallia sp. RD1]UTI41081.1 hypothetical protein NKG37_19790 [Niallia sp. RD1]